MRPGASPMRRLALWLTALTLVAPAAAAAQSLWREGAPGASLFADHRARHVDDVLTIIIVEQSSSARSANTTTSKDTNRSAAVSQFPSIFDPVTRKPLRPLTDGRSPSQFLEDSLSLDLRSQAAHQGAGSIDRSDRVTGQIAARVVKVLDNGNLLIEGRRAVLVNNETQVITISGIVRPQDVTGNNTVRSSQLADAEIQMEGRGVLADAQRPGLLFRLFDWLRLF